VELSSYRGGSGIPLLSSKQIRRHRKILPQLIVFAATFNQAGVMPVLTTAIFWFVQIISVIDIPTSGTGRFGSLKFVYWIGYFFLMYYLVHFIQQLF
jgi:hypothetical protein